MEHKDSNKILIGKMKKIAKSLAKFYTVKIGLLAGKGGEIPVSANMDLAGVGAVQEYGAEIPVTDKMRAFFRYNFGINLKKTTTHIKIPARSWLYEPLKDSNFKKMIFDYIGDEDVFEEYADKDVMKEVANLIGEVGLLQIHKAFDNSGINGEWAPNSPVTIAQKGSSKPLIGKEGLLRKHIMFEVE